LQESVLRVIDANANRSREGLRVLEDVARFVLDEEELRSRAKAFRHEVTRCVNALRADASVLGGGLWAARESEEDVGRAGFGGDEGRREAMEGIVLANARRVQEALRVLEEFSKLADEGIASQLKDLRYSVYTLEKELIASLGGRL